MSDLPNGLPTGTLTLLFTDIEGSTRLLAHLVDRYASVLSECRQVLRSAFEQWNGHEVDTQGDAFFVVFARATDAVSAAVAAQHALASHTFPARAEVRVRMGLHTGAPQRTAEGYVGLDVHRAARLMSAGHGGQVLLSQTTASLLAQELPENVSLRDLGEHHLKDLGRPTRVFQLVLADLPADFPPLHTLESVLNNLPVQPTPLVGREREVAAIGELLQREAIRLVTLTGPGGTGKTRLGLQVAADLIDQFADGVFFVDLSSLTDPDLVVPTIAGALAIRDGSGRTLLERLEEEVRQRQLLLLLDNFEHVISRAGQVAALLAACPQLTILVTSREVLHIRAEHEFPVPPLAVPDPDHLPDLAPLAETAAVALFLQRAQSVQPEFQLTDDNARAVATLCARLDGLPLAIELAAARMKLFTPQALLTRLGQPLSVLASTTRDAPVRQQTLRNTIAWSYDVLDVEDQRLFRRLSVFVGGCRLSAIEALCTSPGGESAPVLDILASLVDKSLLHRMKQQTGEEPRFAMLATIRAYGLERLEAVGELEAAREAHATYFLQLAEDAEQGMTGPQQAAWLEDLERELDNLRAAFQWFLDQAEEGKEAGTARVLRLGGALYAFWFVRAHFSEGRDFLERALARGGEVATAVRAKALYAAAQLHDTLGARDRAEALCKESRALYQELGDTKGVASCLHLLADIAWGRWNLAVARALGEESLLLFRTLGDQRSVAYLLYHLGGLAVEQGEYARGRALLTESLAINRELGDTRIIAVALIKLALSYRLSEGTLAQAHPLLDESLALSREVGDQVSIANCLHLSGMLALDEGHAASARLLIEQALTLFQETQQQDGIALALCALAAVATAEGDAARSQELYEECLGATRESGDRWTIGPGLEGLAAVVAAHGSSVWAAHLWGAAEALREAIGIPLPPVERASYDRAVAAARTQLGEHAFAVAWAKGRTMSPAQAVAAREHVALPAATPRDRSFSPATAPLPRYPDGLTRREVEVLRVVAEGLTNEQVAERLVISPRTVDTHLTSIYGKIGVSSRSAATRYAIDHHLV
jgi:predicted ATPase/class 3 adenylate cyclase/DNA-binding CsgD family transcriptional regulator